MYFFTPALSYQYGVAQSSFAGGAAGVAAVALGLVPFPLPVPATLGGEGAGAAPASTGSSMGVVMTTGGSAIGSADGGGLPAGSAETAEVLPGPSSVVGMSATRSGFLEWR